MSRVALDQRWSLFLSNLLPHSPFWQGVFSFISFNERAIILVVLIFFLCIRSISQKHWRDELFTLVAASGATVLLVILLKNVFERVRPREILGIQAKCPSDFSFPSGHAGVAFCIAALLVCFHPKGAPWYILAAVAIGYSRIFLLCHYLGDVIAGAALGVMVGVLSYSLRKRFFPDLPADNTLK